MDGSDSLRFFPCFIKPLCPFVSFVVNIWTLYGVNYQIALLDNLLKMHRNELLLRFLASFRRMIAGNHQ